MVTQQNTAIVVVGSNPGRRILRGGGGGIFTGPGFKPPTKNPEPAALPFSHCFNTRTKESPLLGAVSATDEKPKLCVSVGLTAGLAQGLLG